MFASIYAQIFHAVLPFNYLQKKITCTFQPLHVFSVAYCISNARNAAFDKEISYEPALRKIFHFPLSSCLLSSYLSQEFCFQNLNVLDLSVKNTTTKRYFKLCLIR